jgi:hypothetical protein
VYGCAYDLWIILEGPGVGIVVGGKMNVSCFLSVSTIISVLKQGQQTQIYHYLCKTKTYYPVIEITSSLSLLKETHDSGPSTTPHLSSQPLLPKVLLCFFIILHALLRKIRQTPLYLRSAGIEMTLCDCDRGEGGRGLTGSLFEAEDDLPNAKHLA